MHVLNSLRRPSGWLAALLWSGPALLVTGFFATRMWESLPRAHAAALVAIAGMASMLAFAIRKVARIPLADALAGIFAVALVCFAGPLPILATLSLAAAAYGVAAALTGGASGGTLIAGLALSAGLLGWLLPFPLHFRFVYFLLVAAALLLTRRHVAAGIGNFARVWRAGVTETPGWAAFAVLVAGLASVGCWVPIVQFDDLAYHLGLPAQLQALGYYRMDAQSQIWALAPWSGDVIQAIAQLIAGSEARGAVDGLWLVAIACLSWQLAAAVGLDARARWQSTALVASQPLLAGLAGGMQAELPATAASLALALLVAGAESRASTALLARFAILAGFLLGLKTGFIAIILPLAACLTWRWRACLSVRGAIFAVLLAALICGSSYFYAWLLTGNPLFPLLNGVFHSPLLAQDLQDVRWLAPVGWDLPWQLTFNTRYYAEGWNGAAGFALLGLLGAVPVALANQRTRWLASSAILAFLAAILAVHYLRYTFPALALLMPCLVAALYANASARAGSMLICSLVAANALYQGAAAWTLHNGAITREIAGLDATPTLRHFAPQRLLIATARQVNPAAVVLLCEEKWPFAAELAGRGFVVAHYDPELERAGMAADADPSGAAWRAMFTRAGAGFAIIGESTASAPLRSALSDAHLLQQAGDAQLWQLPMTTSAPVDLVRERDAAARRLWP